MEARNQPTEYVGDPPAWLCGYRFLKISGNKRYAVRVCCPWYQKQEDGRIQYGLEEHVVVVERFYAYWTIRCLAFWKLGEVSRKVKDADNISLMKGIGKDVEIDFRVYLSDREHMAEPEIPDPILLPEMELADISTDKVRYAAECAISQILVRNDALIVEEECWMSDAWKEAKTEEPEGMQRFGPLIPLRDILPTRRHGQNYFGESDPSLIAKYELTAVWNPEEDPIVLQQEMHLRDHLTEEIGVCKKDLVAETMQSRRS